MQLVVALVILLLAMVPRQAQALIDMKNANYSNTWVDMGALRDKNSRNLLDFAVARTYNSRSLHSGLFGFGWCSDVETRLDFYESGLVEVVYCGDGKRQLFGAAQAIAGRGQHIDNLVAKIRQQVGGVDIFNKWSIIHDARHWAWLREVLLKDQSVASGLAKRLGLSLPELTGHTLPELGEGFTSLVFHSDEIHLISPVSPEIYVFDRGGRLISLRHHDGRRVDLAYLKGKPVQVSDSEGNALVFHYGENNKIDSIERYSGWEKTSLLSEYRYNSSDDLIAVKDAWAKLKRYYYNEFHNLIEAKWPDGTSARLYYDDQNDWVISYQDRNDCVENYTYSGGRDRYSAYVLKRCGPEVVASNLFEFWHSDGGYHSLQRVRSIVSNRLADIEYDQRLGQPRRINRSGIITTYKYSPAGHLVSRVSGDTRWEFVEPPTDAGAYSVVEVRTGQDGASVIRNFERDPWGMGDTYFMPEAERARQIPLHTNSVNAANKFVAEFERSTEKFKLKLAEFDRWHQMRKERRFESAVPLAESLDAEFSGLAGSDVGRANVAQLALILADELASTDSARISLALAQFVIRVSHDVDSIDAGRAALLIDKLMLNMGQPSESIRYLREAIGVLKSRALAPPHKTMLALHVALATAERKGGNPRLALEALREVSSPPDGVMERVVWPDEAIEEVAQIYNTAGLYDLALETLMQSKLVFACLVDPRGEWLGEPRGTGAYAGVSALELVENVLRAQGRYDDALAINELRIQRVFKGTPPPHLTLDVQYAGLLNDAALTWTYAGQYATASRLIEKAFDHIKSNDGIRANLLDTRSLVSSRLGLYADALRDSLEALRLTGGRIDSDIASDLSALGRHEEAEAAFKDVIGDLTNRLPPFHPSLADLHVKWAIARMKAGDPLGATQLLDGASENLQEALGFSHWRATRALVTRAEAAIEMHEVEGATHWAARALFSAYAGGLPEWRSTANHILSRASALSKNDEFAIFLAKRAINELQTGRSQLIGLDPSSHVAHMRARHYVYENATSLLVDAGRIGEAQQVISMYKLDELQQFTQRSGPEDPRNVRSPFIGPEADWHAWIDKLANRLGAVSAELSELEALARLGSLNEIHRKRRGQLLDYVGDEQREFYTTLDTIRRETQSANARWSEFAVESATNREASANLRSLISDLSKRSGSKVVALQYIVLDKKLSILVTLPNIQFSREVLVEGEELSQLVQRFREALIDTGVDPRDGGRQLYDLLIAPIASDLKDAGVRTIMVSLTGALRYIPFAALYDGSKYLVEHYRIAMMSEAALISGMRPPQESWNVVGLGVATQVDPQYLALPSVRDEMSAVVRREPGMLTGALPGVAWLDAEFTAERLQHAISDAPAVIHVASHFKFSPGSDTGSFLLLGDGSRLTLRELMGERYRFQSDLVTLSACETAVGGGRDLAGREIEGLASLAQRQGAQAVLATLWPVADASTARFMERFYTARQEGTSVTKSEALQRAQIQLIRGGADLSKGSTSASPDSAGPYSHPYFWAPFILMGNWL